MSSIRAKFECLTVTKSRGAENVQLEVVTSQSDENKQWSQYTPIGSLNLTITNPDAFGAFVPGEEYFLTVEPAK